MKYTHKAFVRWDDLDAFGHVNNAKYLTYAQEARFDWGWYSFAEKKRRANFNGDGSCKSRG